MNAYVNELLKTVVECGYCSGCGVCASYQKSPLVMKLNIDGKFVPELQTENENIFESNVLLTCPFSNSGRNEDDIGADLFSNLVGIEHNEYTGYYLKSFAGYVKEEHYRENGSSGGMVTWIAAQMLKQGMADAIIHVKSCNPDKAGKLFSYQISNNISELVQGTKSKYYPIEMSEVIQYVRDNPLKYAVIGVPCFIKAIRLLAEQDEQIKDRIPYTIGLVCGHLKTDMFSKSLAWQMGIHPDELKSIDFRMKIKDQKASNYGVSACGIVHGKETTKLTPTHQLYVTDWGHGLFKYKACDYCDDVLAETADVTLGDAWLPEYLKDSMGTNICIIRNPAIMTLIEQGSQELELSSISAEKVFESQAGGFRHRREGLSYRLYLKDKSNEWRPKKRIQANDKINSKRKKIYEKRLVLAEESYIAYKKAISGGNFNILMQHMNPLIADYRKLIGKPLPVKACKKIIRKIFGK